MSSLFIKRIAIFAILALIPYSCSFYENRGLLSEYESESEAGKWHYIRDELDRAEESYISAISKAEQMGWIDGVVIAKTHLGSVRTAKANRGTLDYERAEKTYLDAIDSCLGTVRCSKRLIGPIYDHLVILYIVKIKDIDKAESSISKVIELGEQISGDKATQERLSDYEYQLKSNGFTVQAAKLRQRIESQYGSLSK